MVRGRQRRDTPVVGQRASSSTAITAADPDARLSSSLLDLPEAVLCRILALLPLPAIAAASSVCTACRQALLGDYSHLVWRKHLHELERKLRGDDDDYKEGDWLRIHEVIPPYPGPPPPNLVATTDWADWDCRSPGPSRFHPATGQLQYLFHSATEPPKRSRGWMNIPRFTPVWIGLDPPHHCAACGGLRFDTHDAFKAHCRTAMHAELARAPDMRLPASLHDPRLFDPSGWAAMSDARRFFSLHAYLRRVLALLRAPTTLDFARNPANRADRAEIRRQLDWVASSVDEYIAEYPLSERKMARVRGRCTWENVVKHMVTWAEQSFYNSSGLITGSDARDVCIGGYRSFGFGGSASARAFLAGVTGLDFC